MHEASKGLRTEKFWAGMDEGFHCPYCVGFWVTLFIAGVFLASYIVAFWLNIVILVFGVAGVQNYLERSHGQQGGGNQKLSS